MGKIIFWLVVIFVVLFGVRVVNATRLHARRRTAAEAQRKAAATAQPMVRCSECGVYLPKAEALPAGTGFHCPPGACGHRR